MSDSSVEKELMLELNDLREEVGNLLLDEYQLVNLLVSGDDVDFITQSYKNLEANLNSLKTEIRTLTFQWLIYRVLRCPM